LNGCQLPIRGVYPKMRKSPLVAIYTPIYESIFEHLQIIIYLNVRIILPVSIIVIYGGRIDFLTGLVNQYLYTFQSLPQGLHMIAQTQATDHNETRILPNQRKHHFFGFPYRVVNTVK